MEWDATLRNKLHDPSNLFTFFRGGGLLLLEMIMAGM